MELKRSDVNLARPYTPGVCGPGLAKLTFNGSVGLAALTFNGVRRMLFLTCHLAGTNARFHHASATRCAAPLLYF